MALAPWDQAGITAGLAALVVGVAAVAVAARRAERAHRSLDDGPARPDRRQLLERGVLVAGSAALVGVVASAVSYLTDALGGPGGRRYRVGELDDVRTAVARRAEPFVYDPSAGFYLVAYPAADLSAARAAYPADELHGMGLGFVALDQRCPHLGCRVPYCASSGWFECPCHGSRFDRVGELRRGPAPRGLDRYLVDVVGGAVVVDTAHKVLGPPPGVDTTRQPPQGPHCR